MAKHNGKDTTEHDDDATPTIGTPMGNRDNYPLLQVLGNYCLEAKEHSMRIESLYAGIRQLPDPAAPRWIADLQTEMERHHEHDGDNLEKLKLLG